MDCGLYWNGFDLVQTGLVWIGWFRGVSFDRIILLSMDSLILVLFEFYWLSLDNLYLVWLGLLVGFGLFLLCLVFFCFPSLFPSICC